MKKITTSLCSLGLLTLAGSCLADINPYVGVDYYQAWMQGKDSELFNKNALPKSYPGASIYGGVKWMENFATEVGIDWSAKKTKDTTETVNVRPFGSVNVSESNKVRRNGYHLDLVGILPVNECFNVLATVGAGWVKVKVDQTLTASAGALSANLGQGSISSKYRPLARLGVGASYLFTEMFGVRAKVNYENTARVKVNFLGTDYKPFKNTTSLTLGAFVQF